MTFNEFFYDVNAVTGIDVPVQEKIKQSSFPLVIWGAGSLSYSLKKFLDLNDIPVACYWVDGIPEPTFKNNIPVLSREEVFNRFKKFSVIFGHSKYELKNYLRENFPAIQEIFCIPNLCYGRFKGMSRNFFQTHAEKYFDIYKILTDEVSGQCLTAWLKSKISDDIDYILEIPEKYRTVTYFDRETVNPGEEEIYFDVGAYTGDSIDLFLKATNGHYKKMYAFEPEHDSFRKLCRYVEENHLKNVVLSSAGLWNREPF